MDKRSLHSLLPQLTDLVVVNAGTIRVHTPFFMVGAGRELPSLGPG